MSRRWALALLIVAVAFGLGYGIRRLADDGGGNPSELPAGSVERVGVTFRQAAAVPFDTTPKRLLRRFSGKPYAIRRRPKRDLECYVYVVSDRPDTAWSFCFRDGRLRSSSTSPG